MELHINGVEGDYQGCLNAQVPPLSAVRVGAVEGSARLTQLAGGGGCSLLPSLTSPTAVPLDALEPCVLLDTLL